MKQEMTKSDSWQLNQFIARAYGFDGFIRPNSRVEIIDNEIILIDNRPAWFYYIKRLVPTVQTLLDYNFLKKVYVENEAIPYVKEKLAVLRPSIGRFDSSIKQNEFVCVSNEKWDKPFAVGIALYAGEDIAKLKAGEMIKIVHYVGDRIWELTGSV